MSELRWILLGAGLALIAGIYLWGLRARRRSAAAEPARAVIFEQPPASERLEPARIEPLVEFEDEPPLVDGPEFMRHLDGDDEPASARSQTSGRREPTLTSTRTDAIPTLRPEPQSRVEPTLSVHPIEAVEPLQAEPSEAPAPRRPQKILAIRVTASAPARFDGAQLLAALRAEGLGFGRYEIFHCLHEDGRPIYSVASLREPGTFDMEAMPTTYYPGVAMFAVLPGPVPAAEAFDEMIFSARALATHLNGSLTDERGAPLTTLRVGKLREEALEFERGAGPA